ncbi:hypothetical protein ACI1TM_08645 [Lactococcus garvieae]|uniref:hypothetical protein n=1 Tax=Lactococcus garvieae TaxID=1363 RepID=UPI003853877E
MAIQSEFHKDISKFEPTFLWGRTKRQLKMILGMLPGIGLILLEVFLISGWAFWLVSSFTALLTITPPVLIGTGKWQEIQRDLNFAFKYQKRHYNTGRIRRYTAHDFVSKKEIKETDKL